MYIPGHKVGVHTVTSGISVGPGEVTLESGSRGPSRSVVGEFEHDLRDSDRVGPRTVTDSVTASDWVGHVRSIRLVKVDTVPTLREVGLDLHTIGAVPIEVEVLRSNTSLVGRWVDLTSEKESERIGLLAIGTSDQHPQTVRERRDDFVGRRSLQEVVESLTTRERGERRTAVVDPEQLGHPVVTLVGLDRTGGTCGILVFGAVVRSTES
jgi:hypothetical protein